MRLDHIAYRVSDRLKTADFFIDALGYKIQQEFQIDFSDGSKADCIALEPPEKLQPNSLWTLQFFGLSPTIPEYHLAPEIFVSDGTPGSIVADWVASRGGIGGIHHLAYQVKSVQKTMDEWLEKGYAEFSTEKPLSCPGLIQVFTKPSVLTGVIYEFIERGEHGFCKDNVKNLMESSRE
jgi:catechol 2,3-dioxygenase-like lactoylglutathione lyase family enzyme